MGGSPQAKPNQANDAHDNTHTCSLWPDVIVTLRWMLVSDLATFRFRAVYSTEDALRSPRCLRALQLWQELLQFSTAPVENEHKVVKDDVRSSTVGVSHAPVVYRSLCRHLAAAHVQKGGVHPGLSLRREQRHNPGTASCLGSSRLALCVGLPLAIEDARPAEAALAHMAPPANEPPAIAIDLLKGGNPKVMFITYKIDARRRALDRPLTKVEVSDARATAVVDFDASAQIRARWMELFEIKQQRKRVERAVEGAGIAPAVVEGERVEDRVWPASLQGSARSPVAAAVLNTMKAEVGGTAKALEKFAADAKPFVIDQAQVSEEWPCAAMDLWGCGNNLKNKCRLQWASKGIRSDCDVLAGNLNKYVDSLPKETAKGAEVLLRLSHESPEGSRHCWLLLALCIFSPKVQIYVKCALVGHPTVGVTQTHI